MHRDASDLFLGKLTSVEDPERKRKIIGATFIDVFETVGVMGDARSYDYVCALRAVTSTDGMTADSYAFDHAFLAATATRIINEVRGINRVVYDVTSKPPGTIEWE